MIKNFFRIALILVIPLLLATHGRDIWHKAISYFESAHFENLLSLMTPSEQQGESARDDSSNNTVSEDASSEAANVVPPAMPVPSEHKGAPAPPDPLEVVESDRAQQHEQTPLPSQGRTVVVPSMPRLPEPVLSATVDNDADEPDDAESEAVHDNEVDGGLAEVQELNDGEGAEKSDEKQDGRVTISKAIGKGDTFSEIVDPFVSAAEAQRFVDASKKLFSFSRFRPGQPYTVVYDDDNDRLLRFEYEINRHEKLVIEDMGEDEKPAASIEEIVYDKELALVKNSIVSNLFLSMEDVGETPQLALVVANLFAWDINFIRDIQLGDSFSILVEKLYRNGEFKGYGKTLGATFVNSGKKYEAYLFVDGSGKSAYYGPDGKNLKKVLLQSPLSFTRVTSGYTRSRKHPIFGDYRAHLGIDYGAPHGTPIMAVGDGVVTRIGWVGGYGKHIVIRHSKSLESLYSHMSRYAKNLKKGSRVRQGEVIAYVGSTGYSTGPHLDFRLRQNGKFINPAKAINPRAEELAKKEAAAFKEQVAIIRAYMEGKKALELYTAQSEGQ